MHPLHNCDRGQNILRMMRLLPANLRLVQPDSGQQSGKLALFSFQRQPPSYWFAAIKRSSVRSLVEPVGFIRRAVNTTSLRSASTDC